MRMRLAIVIAGAVTAVVLAAQTRVNPTDPQPTCSMCPGYYVPVSELDAYTKKAVVENLLDQQVRDLDIGKAHVAIGMVHRTKLTAPAADSVAEHDQVSEVYHVIDGTATLVLGPDISNRQRRPATLQTVRELNGPGNNGSAIVNGATYSLKPGDVVVVPAGTGHWFTRIDDHIDYLMIRIDPDKLTPLKDEAASRAYLQARAPQPSSSMPRYEVDPAWPKELPGNLIMGQIGGMAVDKDDHIWVFQRPRSNTADELSAAQSPPLALCCVAAPSVLAFDTEGNLLKAWGGPGYIAQWPASEHGIFVDKQGNVWLSGNAAASNDAPEDRQILKFSTDGRLLMTIGRPAAGPDNNQETGYVGRVAAMDADETARELYVADGYGNRRVVVFDMDTGAFKRGWGAYGIPLSQIENGPLPAFSPFGRPARQFLGPVHCIKIANDGLVYVCDRTANRIQVFTKEGAFVKELFVARETLGNGSTWAIAFSNDPRQQYLFVADGRNNVVWIMDRNSGQVLGSFGRNGRNAGQFHWVHQMVADSQGNLYTGEVDTGKRIQKFVVQR